MAVSDEHPAGIRQSRICLNFATKSHQKRKKHPFLRRISPRALSCLLVAILRTRFEITVDALPGQRRAIRLAPTRQRHGQFQQGRPAHPRQNHPRPPDAEELSRTLRLGYSVVSRVRIR